MLTDEEAREVPEPLELLELEMEELEISETRMVRLEDEPIL
jgi:hypothetical protein